MKPDSLSRSQTVTMHRLHRRAARTPRVEAPCSGLSTLPMWIGFRMRADARMRFTTIERLPLSMALKPDGPPLTSAVYAVLPSSEVIVRSTARTPSRPSVPPPSCNETAAHSGGSRETARTSTAMAR